MADIDLLHFAGGLQTETSSFLRRDDQLELAVNVHFNQIGSIKKRLGYSAVSDTLTSSTQGLYSYFRQSDSTRHLFALAGGALKYYDGTWHTVVSSLSATVKAEFRVWVDELFMVGGDATGNFLTTAIVSGTTYSTGGNATGAPKGKYIESFRGQLYIANVQVNGTNYPSRWYSSTIPNAVDGNISWDTSASSLYFEEVYTDNGESIMGLHNNKTLNQLLIFKETSLHTWDTMRIRDVGSVGTSAHRSIVTINYSTLFFNSSGIYAYTGGEPRLISRPIQKWIDGIDQTTLADVFAEKSDNRFYKLFVGTITVDGVAYSNCEIIYSVLDNTFTIYSYHDTFTCYAQYQELGNIRIYAGSSGGFVFKLAARSDAIYDDNGSSISAQFTSKAFDMGVPGSKKFVDRVMIYASSTENLQGRMRTRGKDWSTFFPINESETEKSVNLAEGRFVQFNFSESSKQTPFILEGISLHATITTDNFA